MRPAGLKILCGLLLAAPFASADIIVGTGDPGIGNCLPFACPLSFGVTEYQQLFAASDFAGITAINGFTFFHNLDSVPPKGKNLANGTYTFTLSTVSADLATFTTLIGVGSDNTKIFSGALPATLAIPGILRLGGGGTFIYDPSKGNLLLDIKIAGETTDGNAFLDATQNSAGLFSRAYSATTPPTATDRVNWGLVTKFVTVATPEPSAITLMLLGAVALVPFRRRLLQRD
jgi:hypothetical protein